MRSAFVRTADGRYLNAELTISAFWICPSDERDPEAGWDIVATLYEPDEDGETDFELLGHACCEGHAQLYLDALMGYAAPEPTPIPQGAN